jgi:hypothetical protein
MMRPGRDARVETRFCVRAECPYFNEPQECRYHPDDPLRGPAEWIDEPECAGCGARTREWRIDVDDAMAALMGAYQVDTTGLDPVAVIAAVQRAVGGLRKEQGHA